MRNQYRYFQRGEKTPWIAVPDDGAEAAARADNAVRLTVLSTSKILGGIEGDVVPKEVKFYGPLYFDIDHKGDLPLAIESANRLVTKLIDEYGMDPADIDVFLSGSKGLHLFIDPTAFGLSRSTLHLPAIYRQMAVALFVSGVDMQVYSLRNAFRLVNIQRDDGKYRVQVTVEELRGLNEARYRELVSGPRPDFRPPAKTGMLYNQLHILFEHAQQQARKLLRDVKDSSAVYAPILKQHFEAEAPPCMLQFAEGKRAENKTFNEVATQVAVFAARLNPDGLGAFEPIYERIADNQHSSSYDSYRSRREHMDGQLAYMRNQTQWTFSCNATRSVLRNRCCEECPLEAAVVVETPEDAAKVVGIAARPDGYFDTTQKSPRRLSTFLLEPQYIYNEVMEDGQTRRVGTVAAVKANGNTLGEVTLDERAWLNRTQFLQSLTGISNLSFFGGDGDIQKLKYVTMSDNDLPERSKVNEMGLHIQTINDREVRTYVESSGSINSLMMKDTMVFDEASPFAPPFLLQQRLQMVNADDDMAREGLKHLLRLNETHIMGALVGWAAACHIKQHLMNLHRQFPLVNLWGNAGNGKTTIAAYACVLGGVDFISQHEVLNVPTSTPFVWLDSISSSRTTPLIWDEVNRSGERMPPKRYAAVMELLKGAFNGQVAGKGALSANGRGASVRKYPLVRPTIFCSEQPADMPAVVDRAIQLLLTKQALDERDGHDRKLRPCLDGLKRIAFTLMCASLDTPAMEFNDILNSHIDAMPANVRNRQRYGIGVALTGMTWLRSVMSERGLLDAELISLLDEAEQAVRGHVQWMSEEEASRKTSTEVDKVIADIMEIIDKGQQKDAGVDGIHAPLRGGVHYICNGKGGRKLLYVDARSAHSAYLAEARRKGTTVMLDELSTFVKLAKQEDYCIGLFQDQAILGGRIALGVDVDKAHQRGLPTYYLGQFEDF